VEHFGPHGHVMLGRVVLAIVVRAIGFVPRFQYRQGPDRTRLRVTPYEHIVKLD
jgi:hypothetical protein